MRLERQQLGIFGLIAVMVAVFVTLQFVPLQSRAKAMQQVKSAQLSAESKIDERIKSLTALRTQLSQMRAKVGNYEAKIPNDRMLGIFLQEIADVMNKHDLTDQVVQPDNEIRADNLMCIPVRIQCRGTLSQIFGFFKSLQTLDRLFRIEQVQLKNDTDLKGLVTMIAKGNIYYRTTASSAGGR